MFSSQDSIDFGQAGMNSIRYPQESASPVRKKGRNKHSVRELNSSSKPDTANPFLFSQDSMVASQFSQNFADRMGQLHMFNSQDNSNISSSESNYSVPFMQQSGSANVTTENTYLNSRPTVAPQASSSSYSKQPAAAAFETERPIDIPPPLKNVFLTGTRPHNELYFDPTSSCGDDVAASKKVKRPTKVWIGAFQERPRIITEFEELRLLGEGTFSTVSCVRHRLDGTLYAVKRVKEAISSERQAHTLLREVSALSVLQGCPQIVRYHTSWIDNHHLFIQTELCHLGSLEDLVSPAPSHSSVIYSASVAKRSILSGGNLPPALKAEISADRNRSESFNSIDITDASLLQDECLTAPGPVNHISFMPPPPPAPAAVSAVEGAAATASVSAGASANSSVLMKGGSVGNNTSGASDFVYFTQTQQSQSNQMMTTDEDSGNAASTVRGVSEDLAWLILYDVSCALKYMHDRDMVHLDLRPANIFLTTSAAYKDMDPADPQRLLLDQHSLLAGSRGAATTSVSVAPVSASFSLFSNILNAAPLSSMINDNNINNDNHRISSVSVSSGNTSGSAGIAMSGSKQLYGQGQHRPGQAAVQVDESYDVRAEVERLLVNRQYVLKVGDLGHCCRVDEKNAIQEGQTRYCARELINLDLQEESLDVRKADIFSLGASVYELCLGRLLGAEGEEGIAEWHSIRDGHLDSTALSGYSRSLADTLQQLMHPDPAQRPSAPFLATHYLYSQYPSAGTRKSTIFRTQSTSSGSGDSGGEGGEMVENLLRENAELRARLAQA